MDVDKHHPAPSLLHGTFVFTCSSVSCNERSLVKNSKRPSSWWVLGLLSSSGCCSWWLLSTSLSMLLTHYLFIKFADRPASHPISLKMSWVNMSVVSTEPPALPGHPDELGSPWASRQVWKGGRLGKCTWAGR